MYLLFYLNIYNFIFDYVILLDLVRYEENKKKNINKNIKERWGLFSGKVVTFICFVLVVGFYWFGF